MMYESLNFCPQNSVVQFGDVINDEGSVPVNVLQLQSPEKLDDTCRMDLDELQSVLRRLTLDKVTGVPLRLRNCCDNMESECADESVLQLTEFLESLPVPLLSNCIFEEASECDGFISCITVQEDVGSIIERRSAQYFLKFLSRLSISSQEPVPHLLCLASKRKFLPDVFLTATATAGVFSIVQQPRRIDVMMSEHKQQPNATEPIVVGSPKKQPKPNLMHKFLVTPFRERSDKDKSVGSPAKEVTSTNTSSNNRVTPEKRSLAQRLMSPLKIEIPTTSAVTSKDDFSMCSLIKKSPIAKKQSLTDPRLIRAIGSEVSDNELTIVSPIAKEFPPDVRSVFDVPKELSSRDCEIRVSVDSIDDSDSPSSSNRHSSSDDKENDPEVEGLLSSDPQNIFSMSPPNSAPIYRLPSPPSTHGNDTGYIPHIDFKALHEHYDNSEPLRWNFSPISRGANALRLQMEADTESETQENEDSDWKSFSSERAFSHVIPSSKRKYISIETPPGSSSLLSAHVPISAQTRFENPDDAKLRKLEKRMKSAKRKLDVLEDEFCRANGRKPNEFDRIQCEQMKKYVQDIALLKREIKAVKMAEANVKSILRSPESPSFSTLKESRSVLPLEETIAIAWKVIREQRTQAERPESVDEMSIPQLRQEKLCVQKVLLHLEGAHGRPVEPGDREQVRPLYDWYREVKRTIAKYVSPRGSMCELKTIPEGQDIYFHMLPEIEEEREKRRLTNEMLLTSPVRTFVARSRSLKSLLNVETIDGGAPDEDGNVSAASDCETGEEKGAFSAREDDSHDGSSVGDDESTNQFYANIHRMPLEQLYKVRRRLVDRKRSLRKLVSDADQASAGVVGQGIYDCVTISGNRRKSDKSPTQLEYKKIKAKLKLVDALLSKHRASC